jgi:uncharacterized protein YndB with AHSA1/START domain
MSTNPRNIVADGVLDRRDGKDVIRFERHLAHPVDRVWAALTRPDELIYWWGEAEIDLVEGGRFELRWLNTDQDGNAAVLHGRITRLRPPNLLETSGDLHGVLRWELRPEGGGTRLTFTSTLDLPQEYRTMTVAGWHFHLDALAEELDGGKVDLVNPEGRWEPIHERYVAKLS